MVFRLMQEKPEIVFTFPACMGGVASFNYNIINHSKLISNFHSKVILLKAIEDTRPVFLDEFKSNKVLYFNYSFFENQYLVQKRLSKLLGNSKGLIVTDNALTVESANRFNNPKTIFHLLHDYIYVSQAIHLNRLTDVVIAHSSFFSDAVYASNPSIFANRSFYIPYGVKQISNFPDKEKTRLNLVFLGRLDEGKGVLKLKEIDILLNRKNISVHWAIIGKGPLREALHQQWNGIQNVRFYEPNSTDEVYELLNKQDIFIFPTTFEGTPVSILECLANGIVTITNDLPGGIRDIISQSIGFRCKLNNLEEFANNIEYLDSNRNVLSEMQYNCYNFSKNTYDVSINSDNYFRKFLEFADYKRPDRGVPTKMSRLDHPIFPNSLVLSFRRLKSLIK